MIIDLHCDLLSFLTEQPGRTVNDPLSRCSLPQMVEGRVKVQTLALFAQAGPHSTQRGEKQAAAFLQLLTTPPFALITSEIYCDRSACVNFDFASSQNSHNLSERSIASTPHIHLIAACENGSVFALEDEPLDNALQRLQQLKEQLRHIFYITMTWDGENRFGGGVGSSVGLKSDGKRLLHFLSGKKIGVDLSHTSDTLAAEILEHIDALGLDIPLLASHSNFRTVTPMPRNLPDSIARELIRRKGLIGLNFFAPFIGKDDPKKLIQHVQYALSLGGQDALCFGADFFCDHDGFNLEKKYPNSPFFFTPYQNASCYPHLLNTLTKECGLSPTALHALSHGNALRFLREAILN